MAEIRKVPITQVIESLETTGEWSGWLAPCNVNAFHVCGGWHIGMRVEWKLEAIGIGPSARALKNWINEQREMFCYYNCVPKLGMRVSFWQEVK